MTHPDYRCPGCDRPIEPLAAIRTYHAGCDPYRHVERLEKTLRSMINATTACLGDELDGQHELMRITLESARAALARPAHMKEREW